MKNVILCALLAVASIASATTTNLVYIMNDDPVVIQESDPVATAALSSKVSTDDAAYTQTVAKASTAFSWGNHTGLYLPISWLPSWDDVKNKPNTFTPSAHDHSYTAITNAPWLPTASTNGWTVTQHMDWLLASQTNGWVVAPHEAWLLASATNGWVVAPHEAWLTAEADSIALGRLATHTNRTDNPHVVTAAQLGAVTTSMTNGWTVTQHMNWLLASQTNGWVVAPHEAWLLSSATNGWVVAPHEAWLTAETDPSVDGKIVVHNTNATAHATLFAARASFQVFSNLTGSVTLTNNLEAPISISGTGSVSVAFSGLVSPYPLYFTAQGFTSLTFPAGTYLVGGGMWQTNRVNHFIVWKYSTNLFVNPLISTEIE